MAVTGQRRGFELSRRDNVAVLAWTFEYSVECSVPLDFAWNFWTNVSNWSLDADLGFIEINGPFAAGTRGVTHSKSSGRIEWQIVEAHRGHAVIEFPFPGAACRFTWTFKEVEGGVNITQHCSLEGVRAEVYTKEFGPTLEVSIPIGMRKLCDAMESAKSQ